MEAGINQMQQGLEAHQATGTQLARPTYLAHLAEAYGTLGQPKPGLSLLADALARVEHTGERYYAAELHRLTGELLTMAHDGGQMAASTPEACFQKALDIARQQQAKSWELRAAMSLARLWQQHGKCEEARELLASIYSWFTEGFDTADLQEANTLLQELAS